MASDAAESDLVIVDLGNQKRKRVKQLGRGEGRLFDEVLESVGQLKAEGALRADAQTVVVVVRQKGPKLLGF